MNDSMDDGGACTVPQKNIKQNTAKKVENFLAFNLNKF